MNIKRDRKSIEAVKMLPTNFEFPSCHFNLKIRKPPVVPYKFLSLVVCSRLQMAGKEGRS
jgi:hypothetical protein